MKTVIFKWNPAFSSYSMLHYLEDIWRMRNSNGTDFDYNWSVWDWQQIHKGDRFYMVKVGMFGQIGIVASGTITSDPYQGEDWSGKGRETYYVDFVPDILLNPDALPILTCSTLEQAIPDFEWARGHSGLVLTDEQAQKLEQTWNTFKANNQILLNEADNKRRQEDLIYMKK